MNQYELAERGGSDGLWDWDLATRRIHFSPRWIALLGCETSRFGNTPEEWFDRIHPEDLEPVRREIDAHLESDSLQFELQHRMLHRDGSYRWMACRGVITRDEAGKAVRVAGFHSDITAEKVVDTLTGLPNHLLLMDRLTRSIEIAKRRSDFLFAVLILDLDLPETSAQHPRSTEVDLLMIAVARRLETCLRAGDTVARLAREHVVARSEGNEFIVLIEGLYEVGEAKTVAQRLLKEISAPFDVNGRQMFLSASIGIALSPTGYRNAETALRDADTALHRAQALGKARCEVFDTALLETAQTRLQLEADLKEVLARQELTVVYQPIVSLDSQHISGFEALLRWDHPARGMVSPIEFIPIAEKTGLIIPMGKWVLQEACRQLKAWREDPRISGNLWVSVNLSSVQFNQPSLLTDIRDVLLELELDASGLMLELTEGAIMDNPEAASGVLMQLRVMGVRIGLDDFGTGYSSLAHLRRFPLDYLKIDRSFVKNIETNQDSREIVRTIAGLAHQLSLRVIAEGIENSGQLDLLRSLSCEYGQGFYFSPAVSNEKARMLLRDGCTPSEARDDPSPARESGTEACSHSAPGIADQRSCPDEAQVQRKMRRLTWSRVSLIVGLTTITLLFLGGIIAKFNSMNTPPTAHSSPPSISSATQPPPDIVQPPAPRESQKPSAVEAAPKPARITPKTARKNLPAPDYSYPVIHDHTLGSCNGILKVTREILSFDSEKAKDSFSLAHSEFSYALVKDQLSIKAGSKTYNFKSATALTKEENQTQLQEIAQTISSLHKDSDAKKQ